MSNVNDDNGETQAKAANGRIWLPPTSRGRTRDTGETRDGSAGTGASGEFTTGSRIDEHYQVQAGPLDGGLSGEAEVYECVDTRSNDTVAVKVYRAHRQPNQEVSSRLQGLNHPHIVALREVTHWRGRVVEIQEYCRGGTLNQHAPYSESDLTELLAPIIEALGFCHDQGVVHRDIKPSNLLYRDAELREVVISDFGISSALDDQEQAAGERMTNTAQLNTPEYTPPEQFDDDTRTIGPKTDYYALGITLIHLLNGDSPFSGKPKHEIEAAHNANEIPYPQGLSESFDTLLHGLTQYHAQNRWGYKQVHAWLDGQPVVDDQGRPWVDNTAAPQAPPYPGYPQARTLKQLAAGLDEFDAEYELFRGDIRHWIFHNYFGGPLTQRIDAIVENYTDRRALGVSKLRFVLDSDQPLRVAGHEITSLDGLAELLARDDEAIQQALEDLLWGEYLETWIEATAAACERSAKLAGDIRATRQRLPQRQRRLALTTLSYLLQPRQPITLAPT